MFWTEPRIFGSVSLRTGTPPLGRMVVRQGNMFGVSGDVRYGRCAEYRQPGRNVDPAKGPPGFQWWNRRPRVATHSGFHSANGAANTRESPAKWGSIVHVYLTGAGGYDPELADGQVVPKGSTARLIEQIRVEFTISSPVPVQGNIVYAGPEPGMIAGISRIDVQLPAARPYPYSTISATLVIGGRYGGLPAIFVQ
jgi:uncharacterized protein (TIGR03437 family)